MVSAVIVCRRILFEALWPARLKCERKENGYTNKVTNAVSIAVRRLLVVDMVVTMVVMVASVIEVADDTTVDYVH